MPSPAQDSDTILFMLVFSKADAIACGMTLILIALFLGMGCKKEREGSSVEQCYSNLRQISGAMATFALENNAHFPMYGDKDIPLTSDFDERISVRRYFLAVSGWLPDPAILKCPSDPGAVAKSWSNVRGENISYFLALDADYKTATHVVAGDKNLGTDRPHILSIGNTVLPTWDGGRLHGPQGNVAFADGRVEKVDQAGITNVWLRLESRPFRLVMPQGTTVQKGGLGASP